MVLRKVHYINIIIYWTSGNRVQNENGQLIYEIIKLYPSDNLPVIINQLLSFFKMEAQKMKEVIRNILNNYLEHTIVQKIEIKNILTRDILEESSGNLYKIYDIHELLRLSFDIMGSSISSATCKKLSRDIENLCMIL